MDSASPPNDSQSPAPPEALRAHLEAGGVAAIPTDTVPGLAVLATEVAASGKLTALKQASGGRPYSLHLRNQAELRALLPALPPGLARWLDGQFPGALTVVLPLEWVALPAHLAWTWPKIGLRLPNHPAYSELVEALPAPLFMTSINPHAVAPLAGAALMQWMAEHPQVMLGFEPSELAVAQASTVLEFAPLPQLLRGDLPDDCPAPGLRILCICTGNTCRSPLAAALLRRELASAWGVAVGQLDALGWQIESAGIGASTGAPASEHSIDVGRRHGLDLSKHRSQTAAKALEQDWDLVLGMGSGHLQPLPEQIQAELYAPDGGQIPDPYGQDFEVYLRTFESLQRYARTRVEAWSQWPPLGPPRK
jgi:protein-tyrosine-phosphatase/tRNA A37 threonylcarbamoyladenosine synthetase subunit TsaC/SUA5/YrdC